MSEQTHNAPKRGGLPDKKSDHQGKTVSTDHALDAALEDSFPASDPPSLTPGRKSNDPPEYV
jgi:hypothetical protein